MTAPHGTEPDAPRAGEPAPDPPQQRAISPDDPPPAAAPPRSGGPDDGATAALPQTVGPNGLRNQAVPRAHEPSRPTPPRDPGSGWASAPAPVEPPPARTTVLPGGAARAAGSRPVGARPAPPRPAAAQRPGPAAGRPPARGRRTRLALRRIDPWSVFVFSLITAVFLGIALVVAAATLFAVLGALGVTDSLNQLWAEVSGGSTADPLLTSGRILGGASVLAAVNVVVLTLLATLGSLLYNLCASFTGGLELTLGERE